VSRKLLIGGVLAMRNLRAERPEDGNENGHQGNGHRRVGKMTLLEAAETVERLQGRAAHAAELEALQIARDALLTIVSEGFLTLKDRMRTDGVAVPGAPQPPDLQDAGGPPVPAQH